METSFQPLGIGVGSILNGRYELTRKLGSGAMSAVYEVADRALNREILALKLFSPNINNDPKLIERIQNEVIITRKLTAPSIVRTYDFGESQEGLYYMTMEYVRGVSLDRLIRRTEISSPTFPDIVRFIRDAAEGIAYAHTQGIIHRDLKPANILITEEGQVKIADFGLARALRVSKDLTQVGECVGTPFYMAPEQIQGLNADERTDVYALGIIAFELVAGRVPFEDQNWFQLAKQIISEPLPDVNDFARVPDWFSDFIIKAGAKKPEDRFADAGEVAKLLTEKMESPDFMAVTMRQTQSKIPAVLTGLGNAIVKVAEPVTKGSFSATHALTLGLVVLGFLFLLLISGVGQKDTLQKNLHDKADAVTGLADTMNKITKFVNFMVQNREKIDALAGQIDKAETRDHPDTLESVSAGAPLSESADLPSSSPEVQGPNPPN